MLSGLSSREVTRRLTGEFVGTMFLLIAVVGSGIMAENRSTDGGLQLLQNTFATVGALVALILAFGNVSGAHFNPVVTIADAVIGTFPPTLVAPYALVQTAGGVVGVMIANLMFDLPAVSFSTTDRSASHFVFAEVIATLGLLLVIFLVVRTGESRMVAVAVAGYIGGAYFFTSSTSFANPAVTVARMFSDTFAGIEPSSAPWFIGAQLVGLAVAIPLIRVLIDAPKLASAPERRDSDIA